MHIELFEQHEGVKSGAKNQWYWRTINKGATTAVHGQWDDRTHAARQAKAHIVSCIKPYCDVKDDPVKFTTPEWDKGRKCWVIRWS
jgi:hypothetical protein